METKPKSREELAREVELLKSKIQTLKQAQVRIEREANQLPDAIKANPRVYA
jgi:chaperonin cofactor prefoldin